MTYDDTICAISSATGPAERMIVRLSGSDAWRMLRALSLSPCTRGEGGGEGCFGKELGEANSFDSPNAFSISPSPRVQGEGGCFLPGHASQVELHFSDWVVPAIIYTFIAPRSATGQDVVEFHIPGNPLLARMLLDDLLSSGARLAEPGEFTARAYFNGKLALPQAEAIASLVSAENAAELAAARQLLSGELSRRLAPIMTGLAKTLALLEAAIDFSEEDIRFISDDALQIELNNITSDLDHLLTASHRFDHLAREPSIVLVGPPNAGKSSLLNALSGQQRAIVSDVAGTTRDALWVRLQLPRGPVRLIDVAGLGEARDAIDVQMQARAMATIESADVIVAVRDCTSPVCPTFPRQPQLQLASKSDLGSAAFAGELAVSVREERSILQLRERLDALAFGEPFATTALALNTRHVRAIESAGTHLHAAAQMMASNRIEFTAADLRHALNDLGDVLGQVTPDDVLGQVFASFCIGK